MRIVVDLTAALVQAMRGKDERSMPTPVSRARTGEWGWSRRNSAHIAVRQNAVTFTKRSISEHQTANLGSGVRISSGAPLRYKTGNAKTRRFCACSGDERAQQYAF